jgi:hypothetical protein
LCIDLAAIFYQNLCDIPMSLCASSLQGIAVLSTLSAGIRVIAQQNSDDRLIPKIRSNVQSPYAVFCAIGFPIISRRFLFDSSAQTHQFCHNLTIAFCASGMKSSAVLAITSIDESALLEQHSKYVRFAKTCGRIEWLHVPMFYVCSTVFERSFDIEAGVFSDEHLYNCIATFRTGGLKRVAIPAPAQVNLCVIRQEDFYYASMSLSASSL